MQGLSRLAGSLFSGTKSTEVFHGLGNIVAKKSHDDATTVRGSFNFLEMKSKRSDKMTENLRSTNLGENQFVMNMKIAWKNSTFDSTYNIEEYLVGHLHLAVRSNFTNNEFDADMKG